MTLTGTAVRVIRRAQKLGIRELAARTGLDRGYLSRLERGEIAQPRDRAVIQRIAQVLGISADATPDEVLRHIDQALQVPPETEDAGEEKP